MHITMPVHVRYADSKYDSVLDLLSKCGICDHAVVGDSLTLTSGNGSVIVSREHLMHLASELMKIGGHKPDGNGQFVYLPSIED